MRKLVPGLVLLTVVLAAPAAHAQAPAQSAGVEFFEKKVRPLLSANCYECHSVTGKDVKGGLRLDTPEGILKGGENGPVVTPGNPDTSKLIAAVRHTMQDLMM